MRKNFARYKYTYDVYDRVYVCIYVFTCMCECIYVDIIV